MSTNHNRGKMLALRGGAFVFQLPHIVNTILERAKEDHISITPMKLQKLLYYLYVDYLKTQDSPLFSERFEPWQYGPVLSDVYNAFKSYGSGKINNYMPDASGELRKIVLHKVPELQQSFERVWRDLSLYSGVALSQFTHSKQGAWMKAAKNGLSFLRDDDIKNEITDWSTPDEHA